MILLISIGWVTDFDYYFYRVGAQAIPAVKRIMGKKQNQSQKPKTLQIISSIKHFMQIMNLFVFHSQIITVCIILFAMIGHWGI